MQHLLASTRCIGFTDVCRQYGVGGGTGEEGLIVGVLQAMLL